MIPARVEVTKNIRSAVGKKHKNELKNLFAGNFICGGTLLYNPQSEKTKGGDKKKKSPPEGR